MNRLKVTLIAAFFLIATIPLALMVLLSQNLFGDIIHKEVGNSLGAIADYKLRQLDIYEKSMRSRLKYLPRSRVLIDAVDQHVSALSKNGIDTEAASHSQRYLKSIMWELQAGSGSFNAYIISPDGVVVYQNNIQDDLNTNILSGRYRGSSLSAVFSDVKANRKVATSSFLPYEPSNNVYSFFGATPLLDDGKLVGVLVEQYDNSAISSIATDYTGLGLSGEVVFAVYNDDDALVIAPLRHNSTAAFNMKIAPGQESGTPIHEGLKGNRGVGHSKDYRGTEVLAAWRYIPSLNWGVVVKIDAAEAFAMENSERESIVWIFVLLLTLVSVSGVLIANRILRPVSSMAEKARLIADGDLSQTVSSTSWLEFNKLGDALNNMLGTLRSTIASVNADLWYKDGITKISEVVGADQATPVLAKNIVRTLVDHLDAQAGVIYSHVGPRLELLGYYGLGEDPDVPNELGADEGLLGQAAQDKKMIVINGDKDTNIHIRSGLQESPARSLIIAPLIYHGQVVAVIEIAWLGSIPERAEQLLNFASESISLAIIAADQRKQVQQMLEESQAQTEELQVQQEELRVTNEELRKKSIELRVQSDVLKRAKLETDRQAQELEASSRYKSEFLANMSHELRTPLNSLLILARSLSDNDDANLSADEVESAKVIHDSGKHLLTLINDILDISKVESGKMQINIEDVVVADLLGSLSSRFNHMAKEKGSTFSIKVSRDTPETVATDGAKLNQVLTNLIGNAIKFTENGKVDVLVKPVRGSDKKQMLDISVIDTGIGIPDDKRETIFRAFQQVDGSISRSFGGTGLGLSIAKKLAEVLGGDIVVTSELGKGSCFSLTLPTRLEARVVEDAETEGRSNVSVGMDEEFEAFLGLPAQSNVETTLSSPKFDDDRNCLDKEKPLLLVVEDDPKFAKILLDACHQQNCQAVVAMDGEIGVAMAEQFPVQGVVLDYMLPGLDGGDVLAALKSSEATRNLPVHVLTALDGLSDMQVLGAIGKSVKPTSAAEIKTIISQLLAKESQELQLLVVEDDHATFLALTRLLKSVGVKLSQAQSGAEALKELKAKEYDGVILDLGLPDTNGFDLLDRIQEDQTVNLPPVIVYTGQDLTQEEQDRLSRFTKQVVIKSDQSAERMLEEVHAFASLVSRSNKIKMSLDNNANSNTLMERFADIGEDAGGDEENSPLQDGAIEARPEANANAVKPPAEKQAYARLTDTPDDMIVVSNSSDTPRNSSENKPQSSEGAVSAPRNEGEIEAMISLGASAQFNFKGRTLLLVDDDMRNTFALAKVLRKKGLIVHLAPGGSEAIVEMESNDAIELVLMDIMMPEMDGYEATKRIRKLAGCAQTPIIAVTANAMVGDKEKCLKAGANDYLSKPVDIDRLLALLALWLPAQAEEDSV